MTTSRQLHVPLAERSYDIEITTTGLDQLCPFIADRLRLSHAVVVTDMNVENPHATAAAERLLDLTDNVQVLVVEPGESSKSVEMAEILWEKMLELGAGRKSCVVAVGGGVIGDLAGFVAATYARGVPLVQVPTSLLAQVDSSVGGKVGVNLPGAKNMVGAFWQPRGVFIDTDTLATLPEREYRSGLAEVVKYGVILDEAFFAWLEDHVEEINRRDAEALRRVIYRCCELKARVVTEDEREETARGPC